MKTVQALTESYSALTKLIKLVGQAQSCVNEPARTQRGKDPTADAALDEHRMEVARQVYASVQHMSRIGHETNVIADRLDKSLSAYYGEDK